MLAPRYIAGLSTILLAFTLSVCGGIPPKVANAPDLDETPASFFAPAPGSAGLGAPRALDGDGAANGGVGDGSGAGQNASGSASGSAGVAPPAWTQGCPAVAVTRGYGRLKVTLEGDVFFDFDKHDLKPEALAELELVKREIIDQHPSAAIIVEGHTDSVGTHAYNDGLSLRRARSVAIWLKSKGAGKGGMSERGYGKRHPRVPNDTPENRAKNRRVEIVLIDDATEGPPAPATACKGPLACCELAKSGSEPAAACIGKRVQDWGPHLAKRSLTASGGALSLTSCTTTRNAAIWITSTGEAKVAKLDERGGKQAFRVPSYGKFPHRTAVAEDGSAWITNRESRSYVHLGRDGKLLCSSPYDTCYTRAAAIDADGFAWIGCYNAAELIKVDPRATDGTTMVKAARNEPEIEVPKCKELARVKMDKVRPYGLVADRRGTLWVGINQGRRIAQVDARKHEVMRYVDLTSALKGKCWSPYGIAIDRDQNPWYANFKCGSAVKIDGKSGQLLGYFEPPKFEKKPAEPAPKPSPAPAPEGPTAAAPPESAPDEASEPAYEPTPYLRAIGFDRRGHAWLPDNRGRHVYELDVDGNFVKRVDLGACARRPGGPMGLLGTGSDSEGHMWTVLQSVGRVAEYTTDGKLLGCYPDGKDTPAFRQPYTYSDFTGSSMSLGTSDEGRTTVRLKHGESVDWKLLAVRGATPADTTLCLRVRAGDVGTVQTRKFSDIHCLASPDVGTMTLPLEPLGLERGSALEIELELGSTNPAASPVIFDLSVAAMR